MKLSILLIFLCNVIVSTSIIFHESVSIHLIAVPKIVWGKFFPLVFSKGASVNVTVSDIDTSIFNSEYPLLFQICTPSEISDFPIRSCDFTELQSLCSFSHLTIDTPSFEVSAIIEETNVYYFTFMTCTPSPTSVTLDFISLQSNGDHLGKNLVYAMKVYEVICYFWVVFAACCLILFIFFHQKARIFFAITCMSKFAFLYLSSMSLNYWNQNGVLDNMVHNLLIFSVILSNGMMWISMMYAIYEMCREFFEELTYSSILWGVGVGVIFAIPNIFQFIFGGVLWTSFIFFSVTYVFISTFGFKHSEYFGTSICLFVFSILELLSLLISFNVVAGEWLRFFGEIVYCLVGFSFVFWDLPIFKSKKIEETEMGETQEEK